MNVKVYKKAVRDPRGRLVQRGCIESYYTRADGSAAITKEWFGVSDDGYMVELWARLENSAEEARGSDIAAAKGFAAAKEAAADTALDVEFSGGDFARTIAQLPKNEGFEPADSPFDFFEKNGESLGIYRVDVDGEVFWPLLENEG